MRERHKKEIRIEEGAIDNRLDVLFPLYRKREDSLLSKIERINLEYEIKYHEMFLKESANILKYSEGKIQNLDKSLIDSFYDFEED